MGNLRRSGTSLFRSIALPNLKRKALNSWSAIQDTYLSTKNIFERHRVIFTISTSVASLATAWAGYSLRYLHQTKVEQRLDSIEKAMTSHQHVEHEDIKKIISSRTVSTPACLATAGTSMIIGYGLGWRGGRWFANRRFRREQLKILHQTKPRQWQFLKRPWAQNRSTGSSCKTTKTLGVLHTSELGSHHRSGQKSK